MKRALLCLVGGAAFVLGGVAAADPGTDKGFARAFVDVATGAKGSENVGNVQVSRADDGSLVAANEAQKVAGHSADDAALAKQLKAKLDGDKRIHTKDLDVRVVGGEATVTGVVHTPELGALVVDDALRMPGVSTVKARLIWPQFLNQPAMTAATPRHGG